MSGVPGYGPNRSPTPIRSTIRPRRWNWRSYSTSFSHTPDASRGWMMKKKGPGRKAGDRYGGVLLGEEAVSKAARQGSNPCTPVDCRRGSIPRRGA